MDGIDYIDDDAKTYIHIANGIKKETFHKFSTLMKSL